jgi:hypothetical protein
MRRIFAFQARAKADQVNKEKKEETLISFFNFVYYQSKGGSYSGIFREYLDPEQIKYLKELGYEINKESYKRYEVSW